jgi:hypothetical protein
MFAGFLVDEPEDKNIASSAADIGSPYKKSKTAASSTAVTSPTAAKATASAAVLASPSAADTNALWRSDNAGIEYPQEALGPVLAVALPNLKIDPRLNGYHVRKQLRACGTTCFTLNCKL